MNKRKFIQGAAASLLAMGALGVVPAARAAGMVQCYGIAKAGHNDCAGLAGLHSCKGTSTISYDPGDFAVVPEGTCKKMGGLTMGEAEQVRKDPAAVKAFEAKMRKRLG